MGGNLGLLANALVAGFLVGGLYAAITVGISISFGMVNIANLAHTAFIILGSFTVYLVCVYTGLDPMLVGFLAAPLFYAMGWLIFQVYFYSFEKRGEEGLAGLTFFFGLMFIAEIGLILMFGVDYRFVTAPYIGPTWKVGPVDLPLRMVVPFLVSLLMVAGLQWFLRHTFAGRAMQALSQDSEALRLMSVDPVRAKRNAFALSLATAAIAGACLVIIQPVDPSMGREFIGRVFAICVMGGMGSFPGMLAAAIGLGIAESLTSTFYGPSWSPAVAFTFLLAVLALRPAGLAGRA